MSSDYLCRTCKYRVKLATIEVCKKKKIHKSRINKDKLICEDYKLKTEKNGVEE